MQPARFPCQQAAAGERTCGHARRLPLPAAPGAATAAGAERRGVPVCWLEREEGNCISSCLCSKWVVGLLKWSRNPAELPDVPDGGEGSAARCPSQCPPCICLPYPLLCSSCPAFLRCLCSAAAHLHSLPSALCFNVCQAEADKRGVQLPDFPEPIDSWKAEGARWQQVWLQAGWNCLLPATALRASRPFQMRIKKQLQRAALCAVLPRSCVRLQPISWHAACRLSRQERCLVEGVPMPARCC